LNRLSAISRRVLLAVIALTVLGFVLRLSRYEQSLFGDETSTLYLTRDRGFGEVLSLVSSNKEITPPFYFLLAWAATQLGSAAELIRLPSLIAGTAVIPLTYVVGFRMMGRIAGLIATALVTLSPTLIFTSGDGRAYAVAILLLVASTAAMLAAVRTGRTWWWVAYGGFSLLAMYSHYTAAFVLVGQLAWLLWAHPEARRPALLANVGAALLYLPWVPWLIDDFNSPTVDILAALQGTGFAAKRFALEVWAVGYPYLSPHDVPGVPAALVGLAGFLIAIAAATFRRFRGDRPDSAERRAFDRGLMLAAALLLAAPILELLFAAVGGSDLFGARNLNVAWVGLALTIAGLCVAAGRAWGTIAFVAVLACFAVGAVRTQEIDTKLPAFEAAADFIDANAGPDDVVVDALSPRVTPVPLTSIDAYLPQTRPEFRPGLPEGEPPFVGLTPVPPIGPLLRQAVNEAEGHRLFLVVSDTGLARDGNEATALVVEPVLPGYGKTVRYPLPPGLRIVAEHRWEGLGAVNVVEIEPERPQQRGQGGHG
jgi:4-amino-4-deoxy-L-arabinose transferase-like glycosyltransferase